MIDPARTCLFIPAGLKKFKLDLFLRIAAHIQKLGGLVVQGDPELLAQLPDEVMPIVGCSPELTPLIKQWRARGRNWIYWDRGYARRVFASSLPWGDNGGFYRWHVNAFQLQRLSACPDDRWRALRTDVLPWRKGGRHIVIAAPSRTYMRFHKIESWIADTIDALARATDRQLVIRDKEHCRTRPLQRDLEDAHCVVTHGSITAVESCILGVPVFVHADSAAALVGKTSLAEVEAPAYPDRQPWLNALAYNQFDERELVNGTLWKMLSM